MLIHGITKNKIAGYLQTKIINYWKSITKFVTMSLSKTSDVEHDEHITPRNYTVTKDVKIKVSITTDYQYVDRIIIIFLVSLIGIIIPFLAHLIFDAGNIHIFEKNNLKVW